jgi:hypothetical protein
MSAKLDLTPEQRGFLRALAKSIAGSAKPVKALDTKIMQTGFDRLYMGPWAEVNFRWPQRRVKSLVDLLASLGRAQEDELRSLATDLAVALVDAGHPKAKSTRKAVDIVKKHSKELYGDVPAKIGKPRNLAKNLKRKL